MIALNYLDLFSGIGGFALGLQQAGVTFNKHYYSEIDKYATKVYKRHFPESIELGDITKIKTEGLGKIDLVTFGFPCQDLSVAGKRAGLQGLRSGLFFEAMRIIREIRPPIFIFENVKGLLSSNDGKDFEVVLREVADIGIYECEWQLVNTSWVLPQNRERIYFIGHFGKESGQKVFPITEDYAVRQNQRNGGSLIKLGSIGKDSQGQRVYSIEGSSCQLTSQGGGQGAKTGLYKIHQQDNVQSDKGISRSLVVGCHGNSKHFTKTEIQGDVRRLTPTECCRLQGFPDNWMRKKGKWFISDSQKYKCLGNAVTVNIVQMIAERLFKL